MSPEALLDYLNMFTHDPLLLGIALALATLISEDGALIAGSLLVGHDMVGASHVIFWLTFGILAGDIGLYGLGASARANDWIRKRVPIRRAESFKRWLENREVTVLFLSRLMPGTRLPTYVSYGFLQMSLTRFSLVMAGAAIIWVSAMVFFVREIQGILSQIDRTVGTIGSILVAFLVLYLIPRFIRKRHFVPDAPTEGLEPTQEDNGTARTASRLEDHGEQSS